MCAVESELVRPPVVRIANNRMKQWRGLSDRIGNSINC